MVSCFAIQNFTMKNFVLLEDEMEEKMLYFDDLNFDDTLWLIVSYNRGKKDSPICLRMIRYRGTLTQRKTY